MKFKTLYLIIFLPILYFSMWFIWTIGYGYNSTLDRLIGSLFIFIVIFLPHFLIDEEGESFNEGYEEGFQKGKLEQKKEEIEWLDYILREINIDLTIENLIHIRIKQLQKEIGGIE